MARKTPWASPGPFDHLELLARVKALLRRLDLPKSTSRAPSFRSGDPTVDFAAQDVHLGGQLVPLAAMEYKLLHHLGHNAGGVLRYETLLTKMWDRDDIDEVDYLRVYVGRLRRKLEPDPERPRHIFIERDLGYASGPDA